MSSRAMSAFCCARCASMSLREVSAAWTCWVWPSSLACTSLVQTRSSGAKGLKLGSCRAKADCSSACASAGRTRVRRKRMSSGSTRAWKWAAGPLPVSGNAGVCGPRLRAFWPSGSHRRSRGWGHSHETTGHSSMPRHAVRMSRPNGARSRPNKRASFCKLDMGFNSRRISW